MLKIVSVAENCPSILIDRTDLTRIGRYESGWADSDTVGASARRGILEEVVRDISALKNESDGPA